MIRVLHVDDEGSFLEVASHFMQKTRGLEVQSATSVRSAMDMMSQTSFDVIVSDYQMPETDGIDFLKMIRARGSDIPFILFTGKGRESVVIEALNQGADFYLQKGGDLRSQFHELASMISQAVQSRRASDDLVESRERFRGLANSISDLLVGLDDDFRVTFWNRAAEDVLEIKSAEAIGVTAFDLIPMIKGTPVEDALRTAASSGNMKSAMADLLSADGARTFDVSIYPGVEGLLVFARDITATKATARLLAESEERYKVLVEAAPNATVVFATDKILYANPAAVRMYGGDGESDLLGKRIFDLMPPEFAADTAARIRKMNEESVPVPPRRVKVYTKTGQTIDMEINSIPITFSGRKAFQTILRDVTEDVRAETLLRAHQEELRTIIDSVPAMISYQDVEGRFLRVNRSFADATGIEEELLRGRKVEDVLPGFGEMFSSRDKNVIETGRPLLGALTSYPGKQGVRWARTDKIPYVGDAGEVVGILTVAEDITERKKAEEDASRIKEHLENLLSESSAVTYSCNAEDPFDATYISPNVKRLYGHEPEEFSKIPGFWASMIHPDDSERVLRELQEIFEKGHHFHEYRWKRKDGTYTWIHDETRLIKNEEGVPIQLVGLWLDIADLKKAEAEREKERRDFSLILDSAPILAFYKDEEGKVILVNKAFAETFGKPKEYFIGKTAFDFLPPDIAQGMTDDDQEVMRSGRPKRGIIERYESVEGEGWAQTEKIPVKDEAGNPIGLVGVAQDITERKKAEEALRESEEKFRSIVELSNEWIWMMAPDGRMTYNNPAIETILGYSSEELQGSDTLQHMHDEDRRRIEEMLPGLIERREGWENLVVRWRRKDGSCAVLESNARPIIDAKGVFVGYLGSDRDITERLKTEEALREGEEAFRDLAENSPYALMIGDGKGGLLYVNKRLADLTGYSVDELLNLNAFEKLTRPEDRKSMEERMKKRMEGVSPDESPYERILLRKDGTEVLTELTPTITMWKGENRPLALILDITERKKAEDGLRMVNKKLNLLGGITRHDSLNQLTALKGWLTLAIEQESDDSVRDMLVKAEKAADSLKTHLDFTAQYKSLGMKRPGWMPLAEVVAKVTEGLGRQGISVSIEVEDVEIFADPMLENVFRNLVNNSIAHGGDMDSISFSFEEGNDGLVIIYEDNGVGIPAEEKAKIFARGYGKRHGYGLYLSWEILSITDMTLKETGIPTNGARFEISVPAGNYRRQSE